jgi:hypothetical protein
LISIEDEKEYMTRKNILIGLGIALFGLPLVAMAAPNFSGSWVRDNAKSENVPEPMWLTRSTTAGRGGGGGGRAGGPGARGPGPEVIMTVQQDAGSMTVTSPQGVVTKYSLDGKAMMNATETDMAKASVSASMQGDTFVITTTRPYGGMPGNVTLQQKEVWSLSPDGKALSITVTQSSPAIDKTFHQMYTKK